MITFHSDFIVRKRGFLLRFNTDPFGGYSKDIFNIYSFSLQITTNMCSTAAFEYGSKRAHFEFDFYCSIKPKSVRMCSYSEKCSKIMFK